MMIAVRTVTGGDFRIPCFEIANDRDEAMRFAKEHVEEAGLKSSWEEIKKALETKRQWKDEKSDFEVSFKESKK